MTIIKRKISEIEYGAMKMSFRNLWVCIILVALIIYTDLVIKYNIYGAIFDYPFMYQRALIISIGISLLIATLYSNGPNQKFVQKLLSLLIYISFSITFLLLIPFQVLSKIFVIIELRSKFKIEETKSIINIFSLLISLFIGMFYIGIWIVLYPRIDQHYSGDYLFVLIFIIVIILSFNILNKLLYSVIIYFTKSYTAKRRILQSYYQNFKEKNIIMYIILLYAILYMYSRKYEDNLISAISSSITTIILFDTLVDKWKNKFHKSNTEYRIIEFLSIDIQVVFNQLSKSELENSKLKLKPNTHFKLINHLVLTTSDKSFKKIMEVYEPLISEHQSYDLFIKNLYELESRVISYIISCN